MDDLQSSVDRIDGYYTALKAQRDSLEKEIKELKVDVDILTKTSAVLKHLLDIMVKDEITRMAGLITYGLRTVFDDQDITFVPEMTKKNDKLHIALNTITKGINCEYGSFGGSVAVIESFLLRVLCMLKMKMARLILLDETFVPVGKVYIPNTSQLITELSAKLGMDVLLVTHQEGFQERAAHIYHARESDKGLILEKVK